MNEDYIDLDETTGVDFVYEWQSAEPDNNISKGWRIDIKQRYIYVHHLIADIDLLDKLDAQDISNIEQVIENYLNSK
jgi:hypothetical protein